jgi:hypothetical protein
VVGNNASIFSKSGRCVICGALLTGALYHDPKYLVDHEHPIHEDTRPVATRGIEYPIVGTPGVANAITSTPWDIPIKKNRP